MKKYFVTGCEGFTGKHLVAQLTRRGHSVVGGVRNRARKLSFEKQYGKSLVCDVSDAISVARAVASVKPDVVIHLAGTSQPTYANEEPLTAYQSIVSGWANVLDAVRRTVPRAKALMVSSSDVYGCVCTPQQCANEQTPIHPCDTFGSLKAAAESIAQTFYLNYHLDITIARPFTVIGPGLPEGFFFGSLAKRAAESNQSGGMSWSLPDLDSIRDVTDVRDVVDALERLCETGKPDCAYNICSNKPYTVRQVAETIARAAGRQMTFTPSMDTEPGPIQCCWGDNARLRQETGWSPKLTLEQSAKDMVASYRAPQLQPAATH